LAWNLIPKGTRLSERFVFKQNAQTIRTKVISL
jgi:hypothetical protein